MSNFNQVANEWDNEQKVTMMQKLSSKTKEILNIEKNNKKYDQFLAIFQ